MRRSSHARRRYRPLLEMLERRELLSATLLPNGIGNFTDDDGDLYVVHLAGPGQVLVGLEDANGDGRGGIDEIVLQNTTAASALFVNVVGRDSNGDGRVGVGSITGSSVDLIFAPTADLEGKGIDLSGFLGALHIGDVASGAKIKAGGTANQRTFFFAHELEANTEVNLGSAISLFSAAGVEGGSVGAAAIDFLEIRGDPFNRDEDGPEPIAGDFKANLTLTGFGTPFSPRSLGGAFIAGGVDNAVWNITGEVGVVDIRGAVNSFTFNVHGRLIGLLMGDAASANVAVDANVFFVVAKRWAQGSLSAQALGSLEVLGDPFNRVNDAPAPIAADFNANLTLTGSPNFPMALDRVFIAGSAAGTTWNITGNVGVIEIRGNSNSLNIGVHGRLIGLLLGDAGNTNVTVDESIIFVVAKRWASGNLQARSLEVLEVIGDPFNRVSDVPAPIPADFGAGLTLTGGANLPFVLNRVFIAGGIANASWTLPGDVGVIDIRGTVNNFNLSVRGRLIGLNWGDIVAANVSVEGSIIFVTARRWTAGSLSAQSLIHLEMFGGFSGGQQIAGDFGANLTVSGTSLPPGAPALVVGIFAGTLAGGTWVVGGPANLVLAGGVAANWSASFSGRLGELIVPSGDFSGTLAASALNFVFISRDMVGARILIGANLGTDGRLGGAGAAADVFGNGTLGGMIVIRNVQSSVVAIGLDPVDGMYANGNDTFAGDTSSRLNFLEVVGTASADSFFAAATLPDVVFINRQPVNPEESTLFFDFFRDKFIGTAASGQADENGQVVLRINGQDITFQVVDELTGNPIPGAHVSIGLDPARRWQAVAVVVDPTGQKPIQTIILEGPTGSATSSSGSTRHLFSPTAETGSEPTAPSTPTKLSVADEEDSWARLPPLPPPVPPMLTGILKQLTVGWLDTLPEAKIEERQNGFLKAFFTALNELPKAKFLPPPLTGVAPRVVETKTLPIAEAKKHLDHLAEEIEKESQIGFVFHAIAAAIEGATGPTLVHPFAIVATELAPIALRNAAVLVYEAMGAEEVTFVTIRFGGILVEIPLPKFDTAHPFKRPSFPIKADDPVVPTQVSKKDNPPPPSTSECDYEPATPPNNSASIVHAGEIELYSKGVFGLGLKWKLDDQGRANVKAPAGDYVRRVRTPGGVTQDSNVTIPPGGGSATSTLERPQIARLVLTSTPDLTGFLSPGQFVQFAVKAVDAAGTELKIPHFEPRFQLFNPVGGAVQVATLLDARNGLVQMGPDQGAARVVASFGGITSNAILISNKGQGQPDPAIVVFPTTHLHTSEDGGTDQFQVVLTRAPSGPVKIRLHTSDATEGLMAGAGSPFFGDAVTLEFLPTNFNVPQLVTIQGQNDNIADGDVAYTIITDAAQSTDFRYNFMNAADVNVTNCEHPDELKPPGVTVTPRNGLRTTEGGGKAQFGVRLDSQPTRDVIIELRVSETFGPDGRQRPFEGLLNSGVFGVLVFHPNDWNKEQTVTVTGQDDFIKDGDQPYGIITRNTLSADPNYDGLNVPDVSLVNVDDEQIGIRVTPLTSLTTYEDQSFGPAVFAVQLLSEPTADVRIPITSSNELEGRILRFPPMLVFHPWDWNRSQFFEVKGQDDFFVADGDVPYKVMLGPVRSDDPNYDGKMGEDIDLVNLDDEVSGFIVNAASPLVTTEDGGKAKFTVALKSRPTAVVSIGVRSNDTTEGTVSPQVLTFSPLEGPNQWDKPHEVTVTGADDADPDGPIDYQIVFTAEPTTDPVYNGRKPDDLPARNLDNEVPAPPGSETWRGTLTGTTVGPFVVFFGTDSHYTESSSLVLNVPGSLVDLVFTIGNGLTSFGGTFANTETAVPGNGFPDPAIVTSSTTPVTAVTYVTGFGLPTIQFKKDAATVLMPGVFETDFGTDALMATGIQLSITSHTATQMTGTWQAYLFASNHSGATAAGGTFVLNKG